MTTPRSLYDVLNVSQQAEGVVIEAAYKALMKRYHPDAGEGAGPVPHDAATINEAFSVLKDPRRRAEYDHRLWTRQQAQRLAELKAIHPRRASKFAGWTGWLVAGVLGCAILVLASGRSAVPPRVPVLADGGLPGESPVQAAAAKAAAAEEMRDKAGLPSSAAILARIRAEGGSAAAALPRVQRAAAKPRYVSHRRYRKARTTRAAGVPVQQDDEFRQREGYIY